ncbi:MAG: hypothetical protein PHY45_01365 [Rhodocyclaceae bacterium]|nr:hypothetical protein [Rhodocyclaceae bacterium]
MAGVGFRIRVALAVAAALMATIGIRGVFQASDDPKAAVSPPNAAERAVPPLAEPALSKAAAGKIVAAYLEKVQAKFLAWEPLRQSFLSKIEHDMQLNATEMATKDAEAFKDAAKAVQRDVYSVPTDGSFAPEDDKIFDAASSAADDVMMGDVMLAIEMAVYAKTGHKTADIAAASHDVQKAREAFQHAMLAACQHFDIRSSESGPKTLRAKAVRR